MPAIFATFSASPQFGWLMVKLENFAMHEWELVATTPQLVGMAMAGASPSGPIGSTKESLSNAQSLIEAKDVFADNALIQAILPDAEDPKKAVADARWLRETLLRRLKGHGDNSKEDLQKRVLEDCEKVIDLLERKETRETVDGYRKLLLHIAEKVAKAAKEGDFLGFGGERFSEGERRLYQQLKIRLA